MVPDRKVRTSCFPILSPPFHHVEDSERYSQNIARPSLFFLSLLHIILPPLKSSVTVYVPCTPLCHITKIFNTDEHGCRSLCALSNIESHDLKLNIPRFCQTELLHHQKLLSSIDDNLALQSSSIIKSGERILHKLPISLQRKPCPKPCPNNFHHKFARPELRNFPSFESSI